MSYKVTVLKIVTRKKNSPLVLPVFYSTLYISLLISLFPKYKYMHVYVTLKSRGYKRNRLIFLAFCKNLLKRMRDAISTKIYNFNR